MLPAQTQQSYANGIRDKHMNIAGKLLVKKQNIQMLSPGLSGELKGR